jgi:hemoglobin
MKSTRWIRRVALLLALGCSAAQASAADDTLYRAFGGQDGLVRLMDDFMLRLLADVRMNPFFKDVNQKQVKDQLVVQICELTGGPCKLKGPGMRKIHDGVDITRADFNALVEVLQDAMDARGIAFADQNRLLARLAPLHRDIVNTP